MEPLHQCWQENCPSFSTKTGIRAVSALPSISIIGPEERNSLADYAWRIFSRRYHILGGQTVKFHMISNKFLNQSNGSSCYKGTGESTDADSIKMMKDQKGKKYGRCQTGEVERCLDPVVLFVQQFRQIARKNIGRDNRHRGKRLRHFHPPLHGHRPPPPHHCNPGADLKLEIKILHCKKKIRHPHRAGRGVFSALEEVMKFYGIQKTFVVRRKNRYNKVVSYMRKQEKI